jgi:hypothetical protein
MINAHVVSSLPTPVFQARLEHTLHIQGRAERRTKGYAGRALFLDKHGAAHHELPHDDAKGVHIARLVQPVMQLHLWHRVEGRASADAAGMRLGPLHACARRCWRQPRPEANAS